MKKHLMLLMASGLGHFAWGCDAPVEIDDKFTIAVIPDTQNYLDYVRQKDEGFGIDGADLFVEQMQFIADNTTARGGEIEFVTSVGDVWQNFDRTIDPAHYERGMRQIPFSERTLTRILNRPSEEIVAAVANFEVPMAKRGYDMVSETGVPFSVVPGNHDYDTWWAINLLADPSNPDAEITEDAIQPAVHIGGYNTFNSVFGPESHYFKDKSWYISSYNGGANSAQIFEAGGYKFLHFGFEMQPGDDVLDWAQTVIDLYPDLPTMISTHDFLNNDGERMSNMALAATDPDWHNSAEDVWNDFIRINRQIFMVLNGHVPGQETRIDKNDAGYYVYQLLSDYQGRHMTAIPPLPRSGTKMLGDGWMRLMNFDFSGEVPVINVRTYSTYYKKYSNEMPEYAGWYRDMEQPDMTDEEFNAADHFTLELVDFKTRFGGPK